jgi:hypothetical protein
VNLLHAFLPRQPLRHRTHVVRQSRGYSVAQSLSVPPHLRTFIRTAG